MTPPIWIRLSSYFFIFLGVVSVIIFGVMFAYPESAHNMGVGFFTRRFFYTEHPSLFIGASVLMILAGITGVSILARWKHAYDLGIIYCILALLFFSVPLVFGIRIADNPVGNSILPFMIFGAFLFYLARNRNRWHFSRVFPISRQS